MTEGMLLYSLRREFYFIFRRTNIGYNVSIVLLRWNSKIDPSCCGFSFTFFLFSKNDFFYHALKNIYYGLPARKTVFYYVVFSCLLFLKLVLSDSVDGITCTTQYTGIFKNRFLPEDGYKYAGLICE